LSLYRGIVPGSRFLLKCPMTMHNTTQAKLVSCSRHDVKQKRKELIDDGEKPQKWQSWNTNRFTIVGIKMPSPFPIKKYIIKKMCQWV